MTKKRLLRPSVLVLAGFLATVSLAGCDQKKEASAPPADALPLTTGPETPVVAAPAAAALPAAPKARVVHVRRPSDEYAYVDRAYEMSDAIGEAPPDYGFDYEGVHPWVWRSSNREVRLVEPVDGGYRYYYYQSGASDPYLVRDLDYSYAFSDGQLVAVYDNAGRVLPPDYYDRRADDAGRYLARAQALYEASRRSERRSVNAANWAARRAQLDDARSRWEAQQNQQDAWRSYHAQHEGEARAYWQGERDARERSARSFEDWQGRGYNGPPPAPAGNVGRDDRSSQAVSQPDRGRQDRRNGFGNGQPPVGAQGSAERQTPPPTAIDPTMRSDQARAQAEAARKAAADASAQQQRVSVDAAHQAQAKAAVDARRAQADAERLKYQTQGAAQQQARDKAYAARQAEDKAAADLAAQKQRAAAEAARQAQDKAYAARQAEAKAAEEKLTQQQRIQADAARQAQDKAYAARQAKAAADAAAEQQRVGPARQANGPRVAQPDPARAAGSPAPLTEPLTKEQREARRAAAKKAYDEAHPHDGDTPPRQQ